MTKSDLFALAYMNQMGEQWNPLGQQFTAPSQPGTPEGEPPPTVANPGGSVWHNDSSGKRWMADPYEKPTGPTLPDPPADVPEDVLPQYWHWWAQRQGWNI